MGLEIFQDFGQNTDSLTGAEILPLQIGLRPAAGVKYRYNTLDELATYIRSGGGGGTVTSLSVVTANGISGSVANPTTTPAITLTLGDITPSSVIATGNLSGANLSGTNTGNVTIGTGNGLSLAGQVLSLALASTIAFGTVKVDGTTIVSAGGVISSIATGSVSSVTGLNTDNTDPANPIVKISVDGSTITGLGTPGSPLIAHAPADAVTSVNGLTGVVVLTTANINDSTDRRYVTDAQLVVIGNTSGTNTGNVTIGTGNGLSLAAQAISLALSSGSTTGALSAADWTTFNGKQPAGSYVLQSTTVNGHALSSNVTVTASDVGLGSVTNDAQTKAAIVPNTLPTAGQILVGNAGGTAYAPVALSGDGTLSSLGALIVTKTNGVAFAASATTNTTTTANITDSTNKRFVTDAQLVIIGNTSGTNSGDISLAAVGAVPSNNGASLSGQVLTLQPADGTHPGLLTSGAQTIGGAKTFTGAITASNLSGTNTGDQIVPVNTTATTSQYFTAYNSATGVFTKAQPAFTDISGTAAAAQLPLATTGAFGAVKPDGTTITISAGVISAVAGGAGTVTTVSVVTANGVSGSVANASTTPAITLTLGAITPSSVNGVVLSGGSTPTLAVTGTTTVSGANTGDQTITLTGDVTGSGTGSFAATLGANKVTLAKMANNTPDTLLGYDGSGVASDITIGSGLSLSGGILSSTGGSGTVTTTGSPANGNLTKFSGATSITNGDLSGDITTSGTLATTLATVNSNVGSFGSSTAIPSFTVNGKGLITAASTSVVIAPAGTLTGATLAANVLASSLTSVGTIATGVWNGTAVDATHGGTAQTSWALGDILYSSATNTLSKLAGNTAASKKFLSQTGNGTISAAPAWGILVSGDIPNNAANTTGSAASLSISGQTGLLTFTGLVSTNRIKTVSDAADTILELGGSYTPTGTWTSLTLVTPALGTPASGNLANCTFPTLNQNTTGSAAKWTTARNLAGNSVDGSANVAFANAFIVQGTADSGLTGAQFLGALGTGIVKNTTTTGVLSIAIAADFPTLNQNTTGSAATLTTARSIYGNNFNGSADLAQIIGAAFGGTNNGFFAVTGPTTSTKTFTFPNASATVLTSNAAVTVAQGGTGLATLTANAVMLGAGTGNVAFATIGTSGRVLIDQGAAANPSFNAISGDGTLTNAGVLVVTKTNNVAFAASATTDTTNASNISSGSLALGRIATIATNTVLSNITGGAAVPVANTVTALLDTISSTQGVILYRNATQWVALAVGSSGQLLSSGGAAANPSWITATGTGTVTLVATDATLTGGPITTTGTLGIDLTHANTWVGIQTLTTPVLGTPGSGTLTNCTGLPVSTGISGLGSGIATFLATPSSANLAAAMTNETGSGALVFGTSPTFTTSIILNGTSSGTQTLQAGAAASGTLTLPIATDTLVGLATTDTLTNKRVTKRAPAITQSATPTINTDVTDVAHITGLAQAITSMTTNLSGTPVQGDTLRIDITDNGTARAITWGASFEASTVALPTTTVISTRLDIGFFWNTVTSKWRCVAVA